MTGGIAQNQSPLVSPVTPVTPDVIQNLSRLTIAQKEARLQKAQLDLEEARLQAQKEQFERSMQSQEADRQAQIQTTRMQIEASDARSQREMDFRRSMAEQEMQDAWRRMDAGFRHTMAVNALNFQREMEMAIASQASELELQDLSERHRAETAALEANLATLTALVQSVDQLTLEQITELTKALTDQAKVREEQLQAAATGALAGVNSSVAVPSLIRSINARLQGGVPEAEAVEQEAALVSRVFGDALRAASITIGRDAMLDVAGSVEQAISDLEFLIRVSLSDEGTSGQNQQAIRETLSRLVQVTGGLLDEQAISDIMHTVLLDMSALKQETAVAAAAERREQADRSLWGQISSLWGLTDPNSAQKARVVQQELEGLWRRVDRTIRRGFNPASLTRSPEALRNMAEILTVKALRPDITQQELVQSREFQSLMQLNRATIREGLTGLAAKVQERREAREKLQKAQTETETRTRQMASERQARRQQTRQDLESRIRSLSALGTPATPDAP